MNLIFLGAPGTGKGTQGKIFSAKRKWPHISTGDILRGAVKQGAVLGLRAKEYMDSGQLVPDSLMIDLVAERLSQDDCKQGFILDGFPRTIKQAEVLDSIMKKLNRSIDRVIALVVESKLLIARLTSRRLCRNCGKDYNMLTNPPPQDGHCEVCNGEIYQREDDKEFTVVNRLNVYQKQTQPLIDFYKQQDKLIEIDANQSIEQVQNYIEEALY